MRITGFYNVVSERYQIDLGAYELVMLIGAARMAADAMEECCDASEDLHNIAKKLCDIVQAELHRRNSVKYGIK